ncbi:hypothetical protein [Nocardioides sp. SYSU DS0651]|uniref:hypothetical protein n=1 Tax=Nocardioides sp. SYSU DS0651 TaxID=3415955 RepID=UPI003F4B362F
MSEQPPGSNPYDPQPYRPYGARGQVIGPPPDHPKATTVLILGILSFAVCQLVAPFAWVMGGRVRREIAASDGQVGGHQMVTIGWILGIVGSALLGLSLLALLVVVAVAAAGSA